MSKMQKKEPVLNQLKELVKKAREQKCDTAFQLALVIFKIHNVENKKPTFKAICNVIDDVSPSKLSLALQNLYDWGIVRRDYDLLDNGVVGRYYVLCYPADESIEALYCHITGEKRTYV